ncbi:MAG TPA: hypothetical protein VLC08_08340 [Chitinolyticbacter sp.]|uniref:hypothetical protein n=1 Tax=Chitinolyticbacter albus TaxID=2961951 RepID=UPI00210B09C6|nr:hypothetical protein [Chitinolyticbacter albus]HSC80348.1 hypothetical protein [Chitinolyticbacter sp.]
MSEASRAVQEALTELQETQAVSKPRGPTREAIAKANQAAVHRRRELETMLEERKRAEQDVF